MFIPVSIAQKGHKDKIGHCFMMSCIDWKYEYKIDIKKVGNSYDIARSCDHFITKKANKEYTIDIHS